MSISIFIKRHPLFTYFALTFTISWGGFLMVVGGPGSFPGTKEQLDTLLPVAIMVMLLGPAIVSILLSGLVYGKASLREVFSRLLKWRVGARWYAVALLTAPLLMTAVALAFSLFSAEFLPSILITSDKATVLVSGIAAGFMTVLEELGWTGFAVPRLRLHYGVFATGLIVGVLWGAWHFLVKTWMSGALGFGPFLAVDLFTAVLNLTAYRVLLVWVYDRTGSLLVTTLMHAGLTGGMLILMPQATGMPLITYNLVSAAMAWVVVAAVAVANGWQLSRQPLDYKEEIK